MPESDAKNKTEIQLRCPNCGYDFPISGKLDRYKTYECPKCCYLFTFAGPILH